VQEKQIIEKTEEIEIIKRNSIHLGNKEDKVINLFLQEDQ